MTSNNAIGTYGGYSIFDAGQELKNCAQRGIDSSVFAGKANSYTNNIGDQPGYGYLLMRRADVNELIAAYDDNQDSLHTLVIGIDKEVGSENLYVTLPNIIFVRATRLYPGNEDDPDAMMMVEVADIRYWMLRSFIDSQYNVGSLSTCQEWPLAYKYTGDSDDDCPEHPDDNTTACRPWELREILLDIWQHLPSAYHAYMPTLPTEYDDDWDSWPGRIQVNCCSALTAFCTVLKQIGGFSLGFDPITTTFSIVAPNGLVDNSAYESLIEAARPALLSTTETKDIGASTLPHEIIVTGDAQYCPDEGEPLSTLFYLRPKLTALVEFTEYETERGIGSAGHNPILGTKVILEGRNTDFRSVADESETCCPSEPRTTNPQRWHDNPYFPTPGEDGHTLSRSAATDMAYRYWDQQIAETPTRLVYEGCLPFVHGSSVFQVVWSSTGSANWRTAVGYSKNPDLFFIVSREPLKVQRDVSIDPILIRYFEMKSTIWEGQSVDPHSGLRVDIDCGADGAGNNAYLLEYDSLAGRYRRSRECNPEPPSDPPDCQNYPNSITCPDPYEDSGEPTLPSGSFDFKPTHIVVPGPSFRGMAFGAVERAGNNCDDYNLCQRGDIVAAYPVPKTGVYAAIVGTTSLSGVFHNSYDPDRDSQQQGGGAGIESWEEYICHPEIVPAIPGAEGPEEVEIGDYAWFEVGFGGDQAHSPDSEVGCTDGGFEFRRYVVAYCLTPFKPPENEDDKPKEVLISWNSRTKEWEAASAEGSFEAGCGLETETDEESEDFGKTRIVPEDIAGCGLIADPDNEDEDGNKVACLIKINPEEIAGCGLVSAESNEDEEGNIVGCAIDIDNTALIGCGLLAEEDGCRIAVDPEQIAGNGLRARSPEENCIIDLDLEFIAGCGILINEVTGEIHFDAHDVVDDGLEVVEECKIKVKGGCGIDVTGEGVSVKAEDIAGDGLETFSACNIRVKAGCGISVDSEEGVSVFAGELAGEGLTVGEDCYIDVDVGCGLKIEDNKVMVDSLELVGTGLQQEGDCTIGVAAGCGITTDNGLVELDADLVAGDGLEVQGGCTIGVKAGCGILINDDGAIQVAPEEIIGEGLLVDVGSNDGGCSIKIDCDWIKENCSITDSVFSCVTAISLECLKFKITATLFQIDNEGIHQLSNSLTYIDFTDPLVAANYDAGKKQALIHDAAGCFEWMDIEACS